VGESRRHTNATHTASTTMSSPNALHHCLCETNAAAADGEGEIGRAVKKTCTVTECKSMASISRLSFTRRMLLGDKA